MVGLPNSTNIVTVHKDTTLRIYSLGHNKLVFKNRLGLSEEEGLSSIQVSMNGYLLAAVSTNCIKVFDTRKMKVVSTLGHSLGITLNIAFGKGGTILYGAKDN